MFYTRQLNDPRDLLRTALSAAVTQLCAPAGPGYQTLEEIQKDEVEFKKAFHRGLFQFHCENIHNIMFAEQRLKALKNDKSEAGDASNKRTWLYLRQIFRAFNDCIAWTVFEEPSFTINRLCRHRSRGYLEDQNPDSVLKIISDLSKTGDTLAIWNDATRAIDLDDITAISLKPSQLSFIELKEGRVNGEILEVFKGHDEPDVLKRTEKFFSDRGSVGLEQLKRVLKQQMHRDKLFTLVSNDDVEDPFINKKRTAITPSRPLEGYDLIELTGLLKEVRENEFASITVDNCLHILAINQRRRLTNISIDWLIEKELKSKMSRRAQSEPDCTGILIPLQETFYSPISMPVMIRPLEPLDIADICIGNVLIYFMFDINAWGKLFRECRLSWSSVKEGRREGSKPFLERKMVVDDRIPMIIVPSGDSEIHLGDKIIPRLVCEGIRPSSLASCYEEMLCSE